MTKYTEADQEGREHSFQGHLNKLKLSGSLPGSPRRQGLLGSVSSIISRLNPFHGGRAQPSSDEVVVWLFDNAAWRPEPFYTSAAQPYQAEFIAAFFRKGSGQQASDLVGEIGRALGIAKGDAAEKRIEERIRPLLNVILPQHTARIAINHRDGAADGAQQLRQIGPSGADGISRDVLVLPNGNSSTWADGDTMSTPVLDVASHMSGTTNIVEGTGWAVISDIDDTIKKTLTAAPTGILRTTFADEPEPIQGMPEFYAYMAQKLGAANAAAGPATNGSSSGGGGIGGGGAAAKPLPFWYLSASPYNLYPFLREFRDAHYPHGSFLLKNASWMNLLGFIGSMAMSTKEYKVDHMRVLFQRYPRRSMVCVGDSTQSDPEAYAEMYRAQPRWIKKIFIRKVENVAEITDFEPGKGQEQRNAPERFEKAFKNVPRDVWYVFTDPKELYAKIDELLAVPNGAA